MQLEILIEPFPHAIVRNFYTEQELSDIWRELKFLSVNNKLLPPEETGAATDGRNPTKNNYGVYLDKTYTNRKLSDILTHSRKLFSPDLIGELVKSHWMFNYLKHCNMDTTLLSYYENGAYYKPHVDYCTLTALTHLYKEPKCFSGGELSFSKFDYNCGLENNRMILFPSVLEHEVSEIKMAEDIKFGGRYTISQFVMLG